MMSASGILQAKAARLAVHATLNGSARSEDARSQVRTAAGETSRSPANDRKVSISGNDAAA